MKITNLISTSVCLSTLAGYSINNIQDLKNSLQLARSTSTASPPASSSATKLRIQTNSKSSAATPAKTTTPTTATNPTGAKESSSDLGISNLLGGSLLGNLLGWNLDTKQSLLAGLLGLKRKEEPGTKLLGNGEDKGVLGLGFNSLSTIPVVGPLLGLVGVEDVLDALPV